MIDFLIIRLAERGSRFPNPNLYPPALLYLGTSRTSRASSTTSSSSTGTTATTRASPRRPPTRQGHRRRPRPTSRSSSSSTHRRRPRRPPLARRAGWRRKGPWARPQRRWAPRPSTPGRLHLQRPARRGRSRALPQRPAAADARLPERPLHPAPAHAAAPSEHAAGRASPGLRAPAFTSAVPAAACPCGAAGDDDGQHKHGGGPDAVAAWGKGQREQGGARPGQGYAGRAVGAL